MRIWTPKALGVAVVLLLGGACSIDDNSSEVIVEVSSTTPVVVRGDKTSLHARAIRVVGTDTIEIKNIRFAWSSSDRNIGTVEGDDFGGAEVTGVNPGNIDISAVAVAFEGATVGTMPIRVANFLEVDSVRPTSVKWGDKVALYGVGVRNVLIADLGAPLFPDTLTFTGDRDGLGRMEFWVPPPARSSQLFGIGPGVFFTAPETTAVDTTDLYEFNDTIVRQINLDGTPPYPTLPQVLFFNPALAFEEPPRTGGITSQRFEWYRFARSDTTRPLTLVLRPAGIADSNDLFLVISDSIRYLGGAHNPGIDPTWFVTTEAAHHCTGRGAIPGGPPVSGSMFFFDQSRRDSLALSFKRLPGYGGTRGVHVLAFYSQPQRYALAFTEGFQPTDPRIGQDRFEENDQCSFADSNFVAPATNITTTVTTVPILIATTFQDSSLTIDTPWEFDFYRFRVNAAAAESVMFQLRSRPFGGPLGIDRSDLDLYVVRATDMALMGSAASVGTRDSTRLLLAPGDYYLVVVDFAGEVTRYSVCIRPRLPCAPLVTAVEASAVMAPKFRTKKDRTAASAASRQPGDPRNRFREP